MFGSVASDKSYVRLRNNTKTASVVDSSILIDFNDKAQRRSSFLPQELALDAQSLQQDRSFSTGVTYCGAVFVTPMERNDPKEMTKFATGSKYLGQWNRLGIAGKGVYKYSHGAIYDGHFNRNGEFHGSGILTYPSGQRLEGFWKNGKLSPGASFITRDNTMFNDEYCRMPDRRYQSEIATELQPADQENVTNSQPPVAIPAGCYDSGDGFYDPTLKVIKSYYNSDIMTPLNDIDAFINEERRKIYNRMLHQSPSEIDFLRQMMRWKTNTKHAIESIPKAGREEWIKKNCRRAFTESTGYKPELYEIWTSGARKYIQRATIPDFDFMSSTGMGTTKSTLSDFNIHYDSQYNSFLPFTELSLGTRESSVQTLSTMFVQPLGSTQNNIISFKQFTSKNFHILHRQSIVSSVSKVSRKSKQPGKHSTFKHVEYKRGKRSTQCSKPSRTYKSRVSPETT